MLCALAPWREVFALLLAAAFVAAISNNITAAEAVSGPPARDPAKIIGSDQCTKCHQSEMQQWMHTPHFTTFDSLHRLPRAKEIADKLGISRNMVEKHIIKALIHCREVRSEIYF